MTAADDGLTALETHWLAEAHGPDRLRQARKTVAGKLAARAQGRNVSFDRSTADKDELALLAAEFAYELMAIEGLDILSTDSTTAETESLEQQCIAACSQAFDILRFLTLPSDPIECIFFTMRLSAIAWCARRPADLQAWFSEHQSALGGFDADGAAWNDQILYRLFECWTLLFGGSAQTAYGTIRRIGKRLRHDQNGQENSYFTGRQSSWKNKVRACHIIAHYHWVKATETLSEFLANGRPDNITSKTDEQYDAAIRAAAHARRQGTGCRTALDEGGFTRDRIARPAQRLTPVNRSFFPLVLRRSAALVVRL